MNAPIALSCGDPAGIGPEITIAARQQAELDFFVIGDPRHFNGLGMDLAEIAAPEHMQAVPPDKLPILPVAFAKPATRGHPDPDNAAGVIAAIETAVRLAQSGAVAALCTNPIAKSVLVEGAGFAHPGHTEFLAHLGGVDRSVMMLAGPDLRVVPATIHIALKDVAKALTPAVLRETIEITAASLRRDFGIKAPRIAVAGLNPHAGECGLMGDEEDDWIRDLIDQMRGEGHVLAGPLPADTMFHGPARARYDAAVCMYHDQALIPIKTLSFDDGVNCTLGLPFVRTSPDHGTAFDIAGKGLARPDSLIAALRMADHMARNRAAHG